jgi:hypothetical protein
LELKEESETDKLAAVKNQRTYRRFNGMVFLATAGCAAVLLFESFFIFELYENLPVWAGELLFISSPDRLEDPAPEEAVPAVEEKRLPLPETSPEPEPADAEQKTEPVPVG